MDAMLHCRKARVEDGGVSSIPLLLQSMHWFSFLFFPFQHTHLSLGLSSKSSLWGHGTISAQIAQCWDRVNRRLQPENLTTISYAISSAHHNKVFHWDYTTLHNASQGQLPQPEPRVKGNPSQKSHTAGSLWCTPPRTDQATITCRISCLLWNAVFLALGYVEFQTKVMQTCDRLSQSERERERFIRGISFASNTAFFEGFTPSWCYLQGL